MLKLWIHEWVEHGISVIHYLQQYFSYTVVVVSFIGGNYFIRLYNFIFNKFDIVIYALEYLYGETCN